MSRSDVDRPSLVFVVLGGLVSFGALLGVWIALAGQPDEQDLVAGGCTAAVCAVLGFYVSQRGRAVPSFARSDLRIVAALPKQVLVETVQVFKLAARRPFGAPGALGSWSTVVLDAPRPDAGAAGGWQAARRHSVLTALRSASPNTIVVEVDPRAGTALIHTLVAQPDPMQEH